MKYWYKSSTYFKMVFKKVFEIHSLKNLMQLTNLCFLIDFNTNLVKIKVKQLISKYVDKKIL